MAELIQMPIGWLTQMGPRNHVLHGGPDPTQGMANFCSCPTHWKAWWNCCDVCSKKSITASTWLLQPSELFWLACHVNFSRAKQSASCDVASRINSFFWSFLIITGNYSVVFWKFKFSKCNVLSYYRSSLWFTDFSSNVQFVLHVENSYS